MPLTLCASILAFFWVLVQQKVGTFIFSTLYGFFAGAITTATAPIDVSMCPNPESVGVRMGMLLFPWALDLLIGTPIGGALLSSPRGWLSVQIFTGSILMVAFTFAVLTRISKHGRKLRIKC